MKENNELLMHIYQNSDMGIKSTKKLIKLLKDKNNKIKSLLECELKEYERFFKDCKEILKESEIKPKSKVMANIMANTMMEKEVTSDNSDSNLASILTSGFVMGTIDLTKKISDYKGETSREILKLAKRSLEFQNNQIEKLKEYL